MSSEEPRRRGDAVGLSAIASFILSGLAIEQLSQSLGAGGWISRISIALTVVLAGCWVVLNLPVWWQRLGRSRGAAPATGPGAEPELRARAEQAERWLLALGSDAGGLAAAEWFGRREPALRALLETVDRTPATVADLAQICDALDAWYVRQRQPAELLEMSDYLAALGDLTGRRDLEELAAVRAATAYRLMGDLDAATTRLGVSDNVAPRGRTAAALTTRRQVERALLNLAMADRYPDGNDRADAVQNAHDRLDDARAARPSPDLSADIAIQIDLGLVHLYRQDADRALTHLRLAAARAAAANDVSAQAHALELTGVAAWMQGNGPEAAGWWQHAEDLYADVDEREGRARCLQHLGSAALLAGHHRKALRLLEHSARLREDPASHELLTRYLAQAHERVGDQEEPPDEPSHPIRWTRVFGMLRR